jgi:hypothetical protein
VGEEGGVSAKVPFFAHYMLGWTSLIPKPETSQRRFWGRRLSRLRVGQGGNRANSGRSPQRSEHNRNPHAMARSAKSLGAGVENGDVFSARLVAERAGEPTLAQAACPVRANLRRSASQSQAASLRKSARSSRRGI